MKIQLNVSPEAMPHVVHLIAIYSYANKIRGG